MRVLRLGPFAFTTDTSEAAQIADHVLAIEHFHLGLTTEMCKRKQALRMLHLASQRILAIAVAEAPLAPVIPPSQKPLIPQCAICIPLQMAYDGHRLALEVSDGAKTEHAGAALHGRHAPFFGGPTMSMDQGTAMTTYGHHRSEVLELKGCPACRAEFCLHKEMSISVPSGPSSRPDSERSHKVDKTPLDEAKEFIRCFPEVAFRASGNAGGIDGTNTQGNASHQATEGCIVGFDVLA